MQKSASQTTTVPPTIPLPLQHNNNSPRLQQFGVDATSAIISSFFVSPIVLAVDQALAQSASGQATIMNSFLTSMKSIVTSPIKFLKGPGFKWIYLIYSSTYITANLCKSICAEKNVQNPAFIQWLSTSVVNTAMCINKDYQFARIFGTGAPKPVPPSSLAIWGVRDCLSMFVFFTLPPIVAKMVQEQTGNENLSKYSAQFFVPLIFQYVLTPIHRLGYDLYNNPGNSPQNVARFLKTDYFTSAHLRMVRCIPPWSIGVIMNQELRAKLGNMVSNAGKADI